MITQKPENMREKYMFLFEINRSREGLIRKKKLNESEDVNIRRETWYLLWKDLGFRNDTESEDIGRKLHTLQTYPKLTAKTIVI